MTMMTMTMTTVWRNDDDDMMMVMIVSFIKEALPLVDRFT